MAVQCPWCDYSGMVGSVEAHISGSADEAHRGKVGHDLREYLPQTPDSGEENDSETSVPDLPEPGENDAPPGWALVVATVLFVVVMVAVSSGGVDAGQIDEDSEDGQEVTLVE